LVGAFIGEAAGMKTLNFTVFTWFLVEKDSDRAILISTQVERGRKESRIFLRKAFFSPIRASAEI